MIDSTDSTSYSGEVCFVNIGPRERRKRAISGAVGIAGGFVAALLLALSGAGLAVRLLPFLFFAGGAFGLWQARDKT